MRGESLYERNMKGLAKVTLTVTEALAREGYVFKEHDTDANGRNEIAVTIDNILYYITVE